MDPFAILGVQPDATPDEVAAAYRRQAKRWHPDRANGDGGVDVQARMAEVNIAYDTLRSIARRAAARTPESPVATVAVRSGAAAWLDPTIRRALGPELVSALEDGEEVVLVTPSSTWASPQALLAVTDRRLLWLLDDAVTHRVRYARFRDLVGVGHRLRRPLRRSAVLTVRTVEGRRLSFAELRPATALLIDRHVAAAGVGTRAR